VSAVEPGMRVADMDPGLAMMREIMRRSGVEPEPNHHGTVRKVDGDTAYVDYDDGMYAPCPVAQLRPLPKDGAR
jgi:hypothetical protein